MTKQSHSHRTSVADHRDSHADAQDPIQTAVELLRIQHRVPQTSAYMILVQASVDTRTNLRDTAVRIVEEARNLG